MAKQVVTRFAPSPTGFLHVGGVRTALFAYLWAKKNNGRFILRIEDTDKEREVEGSIDHIKKSLTWLGLNWDGEPYIQSKHLDIYKKYADDLVNKGHAYLDEGAIRFKIPEKKRHNWHDLVFGDLSAGPEALEDFVLIKSDGYPTYNFAHIVDDIEMGITHVMRGEEFISSTPKYLSLYEALGKNPPEFATLPAILGPDGNKKLSKRDGAKDILDYRKDGYLPEAMFNFLSLIGWNPGEGDNREVMSKEEIIKSFDLGHIQRGGAKFNEEKLKWLNKEHMKRLPDYPRGETGTNILANLPDQYKNEKLIPIIADRIYKWSDVGNIAAEDLDFFIKQPIVERSKLIFKNTPEEKIKNNLKLAIKVLENISKTNFTAEEVKNALMLIADNLESRGELLHPVRYALSGRDRSPDPFTIASILGKDETLSRLQKAV